MMLISILLISLCLIAISRASTNFLHLPEKFRKGLTLAGQFGFGFVVGFALYAHGNEIIEGFWTGFSAGKNQITQHP